MACGPPRNTSARYIQRGGAASIIIIVREFFTVLKRMPTPFFSTVLVIFVFHNYLIAGGYDTITKRLG
jgi:hypothetical protein